MMGKRPAVLLAALSAASAGGTVLFLGLRPEPPPPVALHPTAQRLAQATRHIEALSQEALPPAGLRGPRPAPKPRPGPRTLRLSEDDINVYLAASPVARKELERHGVKAVQVTLAPPAGLAFNALVTAAGGVRAMKVEGKLAPDPDLGLHYEVIRAQAGRVPLPPRVVTAQAQTVVAGFLRRAHGRLPLSVQSVRVVGKTLVIVGLPTPPTPKGAQPPATPR